MNHCSLPAWPCLFGKLIMFHGLLVICGHKCRTDLRNILGKLWQAEKISCFEPDL